MPSFFTSYVTTALSLDAPGMQASSIEPETMAQMKDDCERFCQENVNDLAFIDTEAAGEHFWMFRNGLTPLNVTFEGTRSHRLAKASIAFGPYRLTVEDGKVYGG